MSRYLWIIVLFLCQVASAQKVRISDTSNKCVISIFYNSGPRSSRALLHWAFSGTKQIGQHTYSKFDTGSSYMYNAAYIREDTSLNLVYSANLAGDEVVLYDYNWQVGDSIGETSLGAMRVTAIDTALINGFQHKVFQVTDDPNNAYPQIIVEGFGNISYPFMRVSESASATPAPTVVCFSNAQGVPTVIETAPIQRRYFNLSSCKTVNVPEIKPAADHVSIYPQPAHEAFTIQLPNSITGTLHITNSIGQVVYTHAIDNEETIRVSNLACHTGVYYYRIAGNGGQPYTGKLMIE
ncbi:MAG: T9SS type A sorting domain-containing protein [Sphingobacteriales bacterium]|nr:MAG: T9SS type A sorting domain-containing protein [Sphingobacteriales bacterium]